MFKPKFTITPVILAQLTQISEAKAVIDRAGLLPVREALLRQAAVVKMAHTSTSIEGNRLQEYQVKEVAEGRSVNENKNQILEVKNYLAALKLIDLLAEKNSELGMQAILDIHRQTMAGLIDAIKMGALRNNPVYVVNVFSDGHEETIYTPPIFSDVPNLIQELLEWLIQNPQLHPIIRAGLLHYQFETIHPFTDGNGRVGRLLTLLHLYQSGWDFRKCLVLEEYYNANRRKYYEALQTGAIYKSRINQDLTLWLEYFVNGFLTEVLQLKERILTLQTTGSIKITLDESELKIVDFVLTIAKITSSDVVDILKVPKRTAQARLNRLVKLRVLQKLSAGPATYYVLNKS